MHDSAIAYILMALSFWWTAGWRAGVPMLFLILSRIEVSPVYRAINWLPGQWTALVHLIHEASTAFYAHLILTAASKTLPPIPRSISMIWALFELAWCFVTCLLMLVWVRTHDARFINFRCIKQHVV